MSIIILVQQANGLTIEFSTPYSYLPTKIIEKSHVTSLRTPASDEEKYHLAVKLLHMVRAA